MEDFSRHAALARQAFLVLEKAWQLEGGTLVDFKVEFGYDDKGNLLLADVIDNDSWRVMESGAYIDKQVYRDGGALDDVAAKYRRVAEITCASMYRASASSCGAARTRIIRKPSPRRSAISRDMMEVVTCSIHKEPVSGAARSIACCRKCLTRW